MREPATAEGGSQRDPRPSLDAMPPAGPDAAVRGSQPRTALPTPQSPPSPVQQIADRIAADIALQRRGSAAPTARRSARELDGATAQGADRAAASAELGVVTVRIALRNDALELQIETDRRDTARLVHADRETLSSLLRSAGYSVETVTVRAVDPSERPGLASGRSTLRRTARRRSQAGGSQPDARPSGGRAHAEQDRNLHGSRRDSNDEQDGARHRAGDGLYV